MKKLFKLSFLFLCPIVSCDMEQVPATSGLNGSYSSQLVWDKTTLRVCWKDFRQSTQGDRSIVKSAIERAYRQHTVLRFIGWNECPQNRSAYDIFINVFDRRVTSPVGTEFLNSSSGMVLNFTFQNWNTSYCTQSEERRRHCISTLSIHEFGHAIGLRHEHKRRDSPRRCDKIQDRGADGDSYVGSYDAASIMDYCNRGLYNNELSPGDIVTIREMYE